MARALARLDGAGELDRAAEQQQLLGQRRLARVRVGDDREGAAPRDILREGLIGGCFAHWGTFAPRAPALALGTGRQRGERRRRTRLAALERDYTGAAIRR